MIPHQSHTVDYIFGTRAVIETILSGKTIDKVFINKSLKNPLNKELTLLIQQHKIPCKYVPIENLNKITRKNHQGVIAYIAPITFAALSEVIAASYEQGKAPFIIILDGVTDMHNFGAIVRTALCAQIDAIVIPMQGSAAIGGGAMKTSAGALAHLPICRVKNIGTTIHYLQESGLQVIACHEKTKKLPYTTDFTLPTALIFGSENVGISPAHLKIVNAHLQIPMGGPITSLNVSVAAAVVMYEGVRQRTIMD